MLVYRITNTVNGKVYIGIHAKSSNVEARWQQHLDKANWGSVTHFHRAIRKYSPDAFTVEVLYHAKTQEELRKMGTFFIILHQSHKSKNGYNMTMGGDGLLNPRAETREKMRTAAENRKPISEKTRGKLRALRAQHISGCPKGYKFSPEAIRRQNAPKIGRKRAVPGFEGHKHSLESRERIRLWAKEHPPILGLHKRWHVNRQVVKTGCEFCEREVAAHA